MSEKVVERQVKGCVTSLRLLEQFSRLRTRVALISKFEPDILALHFETTKQPKREKVSG